jgi:hypothetical protein
LTGTQVLLLVVSETGLVYTFTTVKLQPIVTKPEGKNLIQACLNAPDVGAENKEVRERIVSLWLLSIEHLGNDGWTDNDFY